MKKFCLFTILFSALLFADVAAQEIQVKSFQKLERDLTARTKPRLDLNDNPCALIKIETTGKDFEFEGNVIGAPLYRKGEVQVYVTQGCRRLTLKHEKYGVLRYEFPEKIEKQVVYELSIKLVEDKNNKIRTLVMPVLSYGSFEQVSYGLMVGVVKKTGGYLKVKTDFGSVSSDLDPVDKASGWYTGEEQQSRFAITAGVLQRVFQRDWKTLYLYAGIGYGSRNYAKEVDGEMDGIQNPYVKINSDCYKGVEAELGAVARFGGVAVSLGVQTNQFKQVEGNIGIGIMF